MLVNIEKVSYNNKKDIRILEIVLTNWFKNPKELNLIEPRMKYPFNFKKWVAMTYLNSNINCFILKKNKWIVGIGNIIFNEDKKLARALHIFIDEKCRQKGLGTKMLKHLESLARDKKMKILTLKVTPKNEPAKYLYEKMGFKKNNNSVEKLLNSNTANNAATNRQKF